MLVTYGGFEIDADTLRAFRAAAKRQGEKYREAITSLMLAYVEESAKGPGAAERLFQMASQRPTDARIPTNDAPIGTEEAESPINDAPTTQNRFARYG